MTKGKNSFTGPGFFLWFDRGNPFLVGDERFALLFLEVDHEFVRLFRKSRPAELFHQECLFHQEWKIVNEFRKMMNFSGFKKTTIVGDFKKKRKPPSIVFRGPLETTPNRPRGLFAKVVGIAGA